VEVLKPGRDAVLDRLGRTSAAARIGARDRLRPMRASPEAVHRRRGPGWPGIACASHLEAEADYLRRRRSTRQLLPDSVVALGPSDHGKARRGRGPPDHAGRGRRRAAARAQLVGTEPELIEREGVSRAVLREAVPPAGASPDIARMRRGPRRRAVRVRAECQARSPMSPRSTWPGGGCAWPTWPSCAPAWETAIAGLAASRIDADGGGPAEGGARGARRSPRKRKRAQVRPRPARRPWRGRGGQPRCPGAGGPGPDQASAGSTRSSASPRKARKPESAPRCIAPHEGHCPRAVESWRP